MSNAADFIAKIEAKRDAYLRSPQLWSQYTRNNAIASDLPDCDRALALGLVAWDQRPHPGPEAVARMQSGRGMEQVIIDDLRAEGWNVIAQQTPYQIVDKKGRVILSGRFEGMLLDPADHPNAAEIFEIKDTSWFVFNRVESEADLRTDLWTRKWWRQCQAYLIQHGKEWMVFVLTHRRQRKHFAVSLDFAEAERILQRAEQAQDLAELLRRDGVKVEGFGEALDELEIAYSPNPRECKSCSFFQRVCFPAIGGDAELLMVDAPELEPLVARYAELEQVGREWKSIDAKLKHDRYRGKTVVAGKYVVTGQWKEKNFSAQPAKPAKPAEVKREWHMVVMDASSPSLGTADGENE